MNRCNYQKEVMSDWVGTWWLKKFKYLSCAVSVLLAIKVISEMKIKYDDEDEDDESEDEDWDEDVDEEWDEGSDEE